MNPYTCSSVLDTLFAGVLPALSIIVFILVTVFMQRIKRNGDQQRQLNYLRRWRTITIIVLIISVVSYLLGRFVTDANAYSGICGRGYGITTGQ